MDDNHLPCPDHRGCAIDLLTSFFAELHNVEEDENITFQNEEVIQIVGAIRDELDVWVEVHELPFGDLGEEAN